MVTAERKIHCDESETQLQGEKYYSRHDLNKELLPDYETDKDDL